MTRPSSTPSSFAPRLQASALVLAGLLVPAGALAAVEPFDACRLLTSDAIAAVQGEEVDHAKASSRAYGGLLRAQCFYSLPTPVRSVSLEIVLPEPGAERPASPAGRWREVFRSAPEERVDEADAEAPVPVSGLGAEAFWVSDRTVGVLYVLEGDAFFRISVGGAEGDAVKRERSERLARQVLERL